MIGVRLKCFTIILLLKLSEIMFTRRLVFHANFWVAQVKLTLLLLSTLFVFDSTVLWNHDQISRQVNSLAWVRRFNVWVLHPFRLVYRLVKNPRPWANLCHLAGSQGRRRAARRCLAGLIWRLVGASFTTLPFFLRPVSMLTTL